MTKADLIALLHGKQQKLHVGGLPCSLRLHGLQFSPEWGFAYCTLSYLDKERKILEAMKLIALEEDLRDRARLAKALESAADHLAAYVGEMYRFGLESGPQALSQLGVKSNAFASDGAHTAYKRWCDSLTAPGENAK